MRSRERRGKQLGRCAGRQFVRLHRYERINPGPAVVTTKIRLTVSSFRAETVITAAGCCAGSNRAGRPIVRVLVYKRFTRRDSRPPVHRKCTLRYYRLYSLRLKAMPFRRHDSVLSLDSNADIVRREHVSIKYRLYYR